MNIESYLQLFLEVGDLPKEMMKREDNRKVESNANAGTAFVPCQGEHWGLAVWTSPDSSGLPLERLVDIRWVFPHEAQANTFHKAMLEVNRDGEPPLPDAPKVGTDCYIFGGANVSQAYYAMTGKTIIITQFIYLFRFANVVVKLYTLGRDGVSPDNQKLTVDFVKQTAEKIVSRIDSGNPPEKPSLWKRLFS